MTELPPEPRQNVLGSIKSVMDKIFQDKPKATPPVSSTPPHAPALQPKRPHISATKIEQCVDYCGYAYYLRYVLKKASPPTSAFLKGSSVHAGAEENFKQKIKSFQDLSKAKVQEISISAFETRFKAEGISMSKDEDSTGLSLTLAAAKDRTAALSALYSENVAPVHQPVLVEEFQKIRLNDELDLLVRLDLINDQDKIVDLKTSKRSWTQQQLDKSFQFDIYGLAYRAIYKKDPAGVITENLVDTGKNTKHVQLCGFRSDVHFKRAIKKINDFLYMTEKEIFQPAAKGSWWCSDSACSFARECKYFQWYQRGGGNVKRPFWMNRKKKEVKK